MYPRRTDVGVGVHCQPPPVAAGEIHPVELEIPGSVGSDDQETAVGRPGRIFLCGGGTSHLDEFRPIGVHAEDVRVALLVGNKGDPSPIR